MTKDKLTQDDPDATDGTWVPDRDIDQATEHLRNEPARTDTTESIPDEAEHTEAVLFDPFADEEEEDEAFDADTLYEGTGEIANLLKDLDALRDAPEATQATQATQATPPEFTEFTEHTTQGTVTGAGSTTSAGTLAGLTPQQIAELQTSTSERSRREALEKFKELRGAQRQALSLIHI